MFPPKKILFPVDFSERSLQVARMAETFAGHWQAELTLLHVVQPMTYNDLPVDLTGAADDQMEKFLAAELKQLDVKKVIAHGDPAVEIVEYARAHQVDLITISTHGYGRFRRFILGAVSAKVLHDAECPVWTDVHLENIPPLEAISFRRVLCTIDLAGRSQPTLEWASKFASEFGAALTVVHAVPAAYIPPDVYTDQNWSQELIQDAAAQTRELLDRLQIQAEIRIEAGEPPQAVRNCAQALNSDLLVIGRSLEAGVLGRLRTNAYSIIRESPCPVVSV